MDNKISVNDIKTGLIKLEDRKKLNLSGLKKLVSFDNEEFIMETLLGPLVIKGSSLEIVKLDTLEGNLIIKGNINSIVYLDGKDNKKSMSFVAKLFK